MTGFSSMKNSKDGSLEDNIPDPSIVVTDEKLHSDTRGTYMLTDAENRGSKKT